MLPIRCNYDLRPIAFEERISKKVFKHSGFYSALLKVGFCNQLELYAMEFSYAKEKSLCKQSQTVVFNKINVMHLK